MLTHSTIHIYLDLIVNTKLDHTYTNRHLHAVVLMSLYQRLSKIAAQGPQNFPILSAHHIGQYVESTLFFGTLTSPGFIYEHFFQAKRGMATLFAKNYIEHQTQDMQLKAYQQNPQVFFERIKANDSNQEFSEFRESCQTLYLLRKEKQDFSIQLTVHFEDGKIHQEKLFYRYNSKRNGFQMIAEDALHPEMAYLIIDMDCFAKSKLPHLVPDCFRERTADGFMQKFKQLPIEKLLYIGFAKDNQIHQTAQKDFDINTKHINYKTFQAVRGLKAHYQPIVAINDLHFAATPKLKL